jgi:hypothetical protein
MLPYIRSHLSGKAVSYFLNAEANAKDSLVLINKLSDNVPSMRLELIASLLRQEKINPILPAYSLYYHNGYADYVYARTVARIAGYNLPVSKYYPLKKLQLSDFITPWLEIFFRHPIYLNKFVSEQHLPSTNFNQKEILIATFKMQEINIKVNKHTIQSFYKNKNHEKVNKYQQISLLTSHPQAFIKSAISTQKSAIFWDTMYIICIKFRLRIGN